MNPYKCEDHHLDLVCRGCVKAMIKRYDVMAKFIFKLVDNHTEFEGTDHISWDAALLLKEIG